MKNKLISLALFSIFITGLAANVFAQEKVDRAKEFRELQDKSRTIQAEKSYRSTTTTEIFTDKSASPTAKYTSITEFLPPDRRRYIFILDNAPTKNEIIIIGRDSFIKDEKGNWKIDDRKSESYAGVGSSSPAKFIEKTSFGGQIVNVYEEQGSSYSEKAGNRDFTTRYWFNSEGRLLRTESEETNLKTKEISRSVSVYEYDLSIKIEAPIIKNAPKTQVKP